MSLVILPTLDIRKPPAGSVLNGTHPLAANLEACFLINEHAGRRLINLAKSQYELYGAYGSFVVLNGYEGIRDTTLYSGGWAAPDRNLCDFDRTEKCSISFGMIWKNGVDGNQFLTKWATTVGPGWGFGAVGGVIYIWFFGTGSYSDSVRAYGNKNIETGQYFSVTLTHDGTGTAAGFRLYINGIPDTLNVVADVWSTSSLNTGVLRLEDIGQSGLNNGIITYFAAWRNRILTQAEAWELTINPHCLISSPRKFYIAPAIAVVETITASSFPMEYLVPPVTAQEVKSQVSGATISHVAKDFPETLIKAAKASELRSKWS